MKRLLDPVPVPFLVSLLVCALAALLLTVGLLYARAIPVLLHLRHP